MDYEFGGYGVIDADYEAARPPFEETLSPSVPRGLNLGRQVFYLERQFPVEFAGARAFLAYPQYFAWRLSGFMASEVTSLGAHTDLWRPSEGALSSMVDRRGWRRLFPPMRNAWDTLGTRQARSRRGYRVSRRRSASSAAPTIRTPRSCRIWYRGAFLSR